MLPAMWMTGQDPTLAVAENYRRFAREEARGRSPAYETLAAWVSGDSAVLRFLDTLPPDKRQPNLLFAAARYLLGAPADAEALRALVCERRDELAGVMLARRTQTNEPARCATLLPTLAQLPEPLALLELGASAGLTLLVDRYSYDYDGHLVVGTDPLAPTLSCTPLGPVPLPTTVPRVSWRAGLDLDPLDVTNDDDVRWLACLLWPGEGDRERRLADAIATARRDPPPVHRGDLLTDLPALANTAPADTTLVVYHSAVLAYVPPRGRQRFTRLIRDLGAQWLSNEGPGVTPGITAPPHEGAPFLLARNGRPLAFADGHGGWLRWLP